MILVYYLKQETIKFILVNNSLQTQNISWGVIFSKVDSQRSSEISILCLHQTPGLVTQLS